MREVIIASAVRTPIGSFNGALSPLSATRLGGIAIAAAVERAGITGDMVDEVMMGNVLSAGLGQAPARQAALGAGLPYGVSCTTINKVCGSGLKAVILAAQAISTGDAEVVVAGGMESMSNAPYLLERARTGYRLGHGELIDSMIKDGLWDVYNNFHMGSAAELCAEKYQITREEMDDFAIESYKRALEAQRSGAFKREIVPVAAPMMEEDEEPRRVDFTKLRTLTPAFTGSGKVTAGNSSSLSDGAAALVVMSGERAAALGIKPLVRIIAHSRSATAPEWFTTAPATVISLLLQKTGHSLSSIDLCEINEAFAASSLAVYRELGLDPQRVNVRGGAVALGHPIGATGARILTTLIHAMIDLDKQRGVAALCIGGGEALAMMVEKG